MANRSDPDPAVEAADAPVTSVLDRFAEAGWSANSLVRDGGRVECGACGEEQAAGDVDVEAVHRIEGASDPDDLQMVVGVRCQGCSEGGALVLGYGPNASEEDAEVYSAIDLDGAPDPIADDDQV